MKDKGKFIIILLVVVVIGGIGDHMGLWDIVPFVGDQGGK